MARNNRIEFNDFDNDSNKKAIRAEDAFRDDDIDSDVVSVDAFDDDDTVEEYTHMRPKKSLFEDVESEEDFSELNRILGTDDDVTEPEKQEETYGDVFINFDEEEKWTDSEFDKTSKLKEAGEGKKPIDLDGVVTADFDDDEDDMFNPRNKREKKKIQKRTMIVLSSVFGALAVILIALFIYVYNIANQSTIYEGISLYGKDLGGMTQSEVAEYIDKMYIDPIKNADVTVVLNGEEFTYPMTDFVECPNAADKAKEAYEIKREGSFFTRFLNILRLKKNGQEISLVYNFIDTSLDKVMDSAESESFSDPVQPTYTVKTDSDGNKTLYFMPGATGTKIDKKTFEKDLLSALSDYEQEMANLGSGESLKNIRIEAVVATVGFKPLDADSIYFENTTGAKNAYYKKSGGRVVAVEAQSGYGPDMDSLIKAVAAINNNEVSAYEEVKFTRIWAEVSKADLEASLFGKTVYLSSVENTLDVVGEDETPVDDTALRANNLAIIREKLNGREFLDGETINFFDLIGSVSASNGYVYARENISGGGRVLGGGMSMAASALYSAASKYSGVVISESSHSEYLPYYGIRAFDAYVNPSSGKNLVLKNTSGAPLKIIAAFDGTNFEISFAVSKYDSNSVKSLSSELKSEETDGNYVVYTYKVSSSSSLLDTTVVYKEVSGVTSTENPTDEPTGTPDGTMDPDATQNPDETTDPSATPGEDSPTSDPTETPSGEPTPTPTVTPTVTDPITPEPTPAPGADSVSE